MPAVLTAVRAGKTLALVNKESLVLGGSLLIAEARKSGSTILPVDSEHSAVFQAMLCGVEFELTEPESLRPHLREIAARLQRAGRLRAVG